MIKKLLSFLFVLLIIGCRQDIKPEQSEIRVFEKNDSIGIGLLLKNVSGKGIPVYLTKNDSLPFDTLKFVEKQHQHIFVTDITSTSLAHHFSPYRARYGKEAAEAVKINKEGASVVPVYELAFRVTEKEESWFGIVINEEENEVVYIRPPYWMAISDFTADRMHAEELFLFISWKNYLTSVPALMGYEGPLYSAADENKPDTVSPFDPGKLYKGIRTRGTWVQIGEPDDRKARPIGYIPWTDGKN